MLVMPASASAIMVAVAIAVVVLRHHKDGKEEQCCQKKQTSLHDREILACKECWSVGCVELT
jgi:hypothetical protein